MCSIIEEQTYDDGVVMRVFYWLNKDVYTDPQVSLDTILEPQAEMNENQDRHEVLIPGGVAYMNESTFDNPDWKKDCYGANYEELLDVKRRYGPSFVLYGTASVGHDGWIVASDGRLCEVGSRI